MPVGMKRNNGFTSYLRKRSLLRKKESDEQGIQGRRWALPCEDPKTGVSSYLPQTPSNLVPGFVNQPGCKINWHVRIGRKPANGQGGQVTVSAAGLVPL